MITIASDQAQLKPSKWPLRMRSPMGLGERGGRPPSPGTPNVDARLFLRPGEAGCFAEIDAGGARPVGFALFWAGGETWGYSNEMMG